eukprot:307298_1
MAISSLILLLLVCIINSTTAAPTTTPAPTTNYTTFVPTIQENKVYASGLLGYLQRINHWINNDVTQSHSILICIVFAVILMCCLGSFYFSQHNKTNKLEQALLSLYPEDKHNENHDIPHIESPYPDSSVVTNSNEQIVEIFDVLPPDDNKDINYKQLVAKPKVFRSRTPSINPNNISHIDSINRRNTYQFGSKQQLEMQNIKKQPLQLTKSVSLELGNDKLKLDNKLIDAEFKKLSDEIDQLHKIEKKQIVKTKNVQQGTVLKHDVDNSSGSLNTSTSSSNNDILLLNIQSSAAPIDVIVDDLKKIENELHRLETLDHNNQFAALKILPLTSVHTETVHDQNITDLDLDNLNEEIKQNLTSPSSQSVSSKLGVIINNETDKQQQQIHNNNDENNVDDCVAALKTSPILNPDNTDSRNNTMIELNVSDDIEDVNSDNEISTDDEVSQTVSENNPKNVVIDVEITKESQLDEIKSKSEDDMDTEQQEQKTGNDMVDSEENNLNDECPSLKTPTTLETSRNDTMIELNISNDTSDIDSDEQVTANDEEITEYVTTNDIQTVTVDIDSKEASESDDNTNDRLYQMQETNNAIDSEESHDLDDEFAALNTSFSNSNDGTVNELHISDDTSTSDIVSDEEIIDHSDELVLNIAEDEIQLTAVDIETQHDLEIKNKLKQVSKTSVNDIIVEEGKYENKSDIDVEQKMDVCIDRQDSYCTPMNPEDDKIALQKRIIAAIDSTVNTIELPFCFDINQIVLAERNNEIGVNCVDHKWPSQIPKMAQMEEYNKNDIAIYKYSWQDDELFQWRYLAIECEMNKFERLELKIEIEKCDVENIESEHDPEDVKIIVHDENAKIDIQEDVDTKQKNDNDENPRVTSPRVTSPRIT